MHGNPSEEPESILRRALRFREFGEYAAARDILESAVQKNPTFAEYWLTLGIIHENLDEVDKARECYQQAVSLKPDWTDPLVHLGQLEFSLMRYKEARSALKKYLELGGNDTNTLVTLAQSAFHIDDCKTVLATTSKIIDIDEDVFEAWELRGLCHAKMSNMSSACVSLNMALELNPSSTASLNTVGDMCYKSQNFNGAVSCYGPSLAKQTEQPEILFRYGTSLWLLGRWSEAIPVLERYTALVPDDPAGWNNLGVALREKGEVVRAIDCYKKALQINPNLDESRNNLETALNKQVIQ
jgi:tetratricopeptide (TPR) repeat protein